MTGFWTLLKVQLFTRYAAFKPSNLKAEIQEKKGKAVGRMLLYAFLFLYVAGLMIFVEVRLLNALLPYGLADLMPGLGLLVSMAGTLVLSFFYMMSSLYLSRDSVFLAALPVRPRTVLAARLMQVWISETLISAALLLPVCILYGVKTGQAVPFYFRLFLIWLFVSVLPVSIGSVIATGLVRLSGFMRHRELFLTVGGLLFMVGYMFLSMKMGSLMGNTAAGGEEMDTLTEAIVRQSDLLSRVTGFFPPVRWAAKGLFGEGGALCLYIAVCVLAAALVLWGLGFFYRKLSLLQADVPLAQNKRKTEKKAAFASRGAFYALCKREMLQILRVPSYATNVLPTAFMPLVMVIMMMLVIGGNMGDQGETMKELLSQLRPEVLMPVLAVLMSWMSVLNPALSTAVSREGAGHAALLSLPVSVQTHLNAKLTVGYSVSLIGVTLAAAGMAVIAPEFSGMILMAFVLCALYTFLCGCFALAHDVKKPKLIWVTEQEAVKNNYGSVLSMLLSWGILGLLAVLSFLLLRAGLTLWPVFGVLTVILLSGAFVSYTYLKRTGEKNYRL